MRRDRGDYYDFLDLRPWGDHRLVVAVGDVVGHGVAAALLMTTARAYFRARARPPGPLAATMDGLNQLLVADTNSAQFMTFFYLVADGPGRAAEWVAAGHDPALHYRAADGTFHERPGRDIPLGVMDTWSYTAHAQADFAAGDLLVIGTDGIWEAHDEAGARFGKDGLQDVVARHAGEPVEAIVDAVVAALRAFRGARPQHDDVTLVVLRFV